MGSGSLMYELDLEYIEKQINELSSTDKGEFITTLLNYDGVLPIELEQLFNPYINPLHIPQAVIIEVRAKHEDKWVEHGRYESFVLPGETFEDCNQRLIQRFVNKTGSPCFVKV